MVEPGYFGGLDAAHLLLIRPQKRRTIVNTQTYHIAVVLLDNYLARITNVPKSILQAIGATCLFIASKLEEFQCRESSEFVKSTNNSCSIEDIHEL